MPVKARAGGTGRVRGGRPGAQQGGGGTPANPAPPSAAAQLLASYTQGLAVDFVNNSAAVKDTGTPANNYDSTVGGLLTLNGSAPSTGPNGGPLLTATTFYTLVIGKFPFNLSEGTMMLEFVRQATASWGQFCQIGANVFDDNLSIRTGATSAYTRFIINGVAADYTGGDGIPQTVAGAYKLNDSGVSFNGGPAPKITSVTPANSGATSLFMEGYTGDSTAVEFLRFVYIPQRLDELTLAAFKPTVPRTFYVDPVSGSDANNGLTTGAAKQTIASVLSGLVRGGDSVAIKGGTTARESTLSFPGSTIITSYGTGKGKISGARIISSGAWVADGTYANVKKAVVAHTVTSAGLFYPMVWDDDVKLTYYIAGADIAANRAYVDTHPGTFTCHQTGSSVSNPQTDSNGTSYTYYVRLSDSTNPASSVMEYAEQVNIITLVGGENFSNVIVQRTSAKDMINKVAGNLPFYSNNADFLEAAVHAIVGSPCQHTNSTATALPSSTPLGAGGGFHFFRDNAAEGVAALSSATNCTATGFDKGFYSHGTAAGAEQVEVDLTDCASVNCSIGIQSGVTTNGWHITRHTHTNCANADVLQGNDVVIS
jgi:hypothetical protein